MVARNVITNDLLLQMDGKAYPQSQAILNTTGRKRASKSDHDIDIIADELVYNACDVFVLEKMCNTHPKTSHNQQDLQQAFSSISHQHDNLVSSENMFLKKRPA